MHLNRSCNETIHEHSLDQTQQVLRKCLLLLYCVIPKEMHSSPEPKVNMCAAQVPIRKNLIKSQTTKSTPEQPHMQRPHTAHVCLEDLALRENTLQKFSWKVNALWDVSGTVMVKRTLSHDCFPHMLQHTLAQHSHDTRLALHHVVMPGWALCCMMMMMPGWHCVTWWCQAGYCATWLCQVGHCAMPHSGARLPLCHMMVSSRPLCYIVMPGWQCATCCLARHQESNGALVSNSTRKISHHLKNSMKSLLKIMKICCPLIINYWMK